MERGRSKLYAVKRRTLDRAGGRSGRDTAFVWSVDAQNCLQASEVRLTGREVIRYKLIK